LRGEPGGVLFEIVDGLGLAVFEDLKILLVEVGDRLVPAASDDHIDDDGPGVGPDDRDRAGIGAWLGRDGSLGADGGGEHADVGDHKKEQAARVHGALRGRPILSQ
jgi:hypothetical protein